MGSTRFGALYTSNTFSHRHGKGLLFYLDRRQKYICIHLLTSFLSSIHLNWTHIASSESLGLFASSRGSSCLLKHTFKEALHSEILQSLPSDLTTSHQIMVAPPSAVKQPPVRSSFSLVPWPNVPRRPCGSDVVTSMPQKPIADTVSRIVFVISQSKSLINTYVANVHWSTIF